MSTLTASLTHRVTMVLSLARRALMRASLARRAAIGGVVALALAWAATAGAGTVNIDLVPVGDVMNVADSATGYGSVSYAYSMGKYDVTMGQYAAFLNAVATSNDPFGLYNSLMATALPTYGITKSTSGGHFVYALASTGSANAPVDYVNWGSAARFVNWLQNGEPTGLGEAAGSTETGTYALNGSMGSLALAAVTRSGTASWVLPSVNEWYKSAYYSGGGTDSSYWIYPTQNNDTPSNVLSTTGTNNANFSIGISVPPFVMPSDPINYLTTVGTFMGSPGPYGTFDQGGDVEQWLDTSDAGMYFKVRGGSFGSDVGFMESAADGEITATGVGGTLGFRVAYVPEPGSAALLIVGCAAALLIRIPRQRSRR